MWVNYVIFQCKFISINQHKNNCTYGTIPAAGSYSLCVWNNNKEKCLPPIQCNRNFVRAINLNLIYLKFKHLQDTVPPFWWNWKPLCAVETFLFFKNFGPDGVNSILANPYYLWVESISHVRWISFPSRSQLSLHVTKATAFLSNTLISDVTSLTLKMLFFCYSIIKKCFSTPSLLFLVSHIKMSDNFVAS